MPLDPIMGPYIYIYNVYKYRGFCSSSQVPKPLAQLVQLARLARLLRIRGQRALKKAQKGVRACPVPPVRSKRLLEPASVPPVRSNRLFESAVQDHSSKRLDSATLCSAPLCSALLSPCMYMHGSTLIYTCVVVFPVFLCLSLFSLRVLQESTPSLTGSCTCNTRRPACKRSAMPASRALFWDNDWQIVLGDPN